MHRPKEIMSMVERGDADAFASELSLDPARTREWFDAGLPDSGYGEEVSRALGAHILQSLRQARANGRGG